MVRRADIAFGYSAGPLDAQGHVTTYALNAAPLTPGSTGQRYFYTDQTCVIRWNATTAAGATDACDLMILQFRGYAHASDLVRVGHSCYTRQVNQRTAFALFFSTIFPCLFGILAIFPATDSIPQSMPSAKSLAQLLEEHYRHPQTLSAVFLERYSEGQKQARIESGTVYFKRPGRMRWEYESPEKKLFLADGKTVWFYVPYDHTVTKAPAKESSDWRTPLALLTGKVELSRLCSRVDLIEQKEVPASHAVLRCFPKGEKKAQPMPESSQPAGGTPEDADFTEVLLEVDKSNGELARIEIRQPGGIELEYRFGEWQVDLTLPAEMFRFQVPVGVAVVDGAALSEGPK